MTEPETIPASGPSRAAQLPRELTDFLVELSVAMHKHAIYPPGHPLLGQAVDNVHRLLAALLRERPALSIGVARRQLIIEGVATGTIHPLLSELAGKLHRHHIGAVKFIRGLTRDELSDALGTVGLEPQRDEQPLGMQPELLDARWTNVKLFPLTYDRLELLDDDEEPGATPRAPSAQDGRAAQLWVGLARAAIASEQRGDDASMEPEQVAHAIDEHDREPAYDQVIVGYLLQIAHEVRRDETPVTAGAGLKRRISKLVASLQPATLRRLLEMGGDNLQRRQFVLDAAQGMNVDAVIDLVRAAASAEGQTISHSLVRMLTKLATHAAADSTVRGRIADDEFRENIERLVGSWSLDDPNPLAYSAALEQMSRSGAEQVAPGNESLYPCEPSRMIAMSLELGAVGESVTRAVNAMTDASSYAELLDLLDAAPPGSGETVEGMWEQLAAANPLAVVLAAPRHDHAIIRRFVERMGAASAAPLLDAIADSPEGGRRDRFLGYLTSLGMEVAPEIAARLAPAAPAVARDLLAALVRIAPPVLPPEARSFLVHQDASVRREAVKLLLAYEESRESALSVAVRDADERVVSAGLLAAQERCSSEAAATVRQRMDRGEIAEVDTRVAAVRAVAAGGDDEALAWLLKMTTVPGGLLRKPRLAPTSPEMLAALGALALRWNADPRAAVALERARESTSPTVRAAVARAGARMTGQFQQIT